MEASLGKKIRGFGLSWLKLSIPFFLAGTLFWILLVWGIGANPYLVAAVPLILYIYAYRGFKRDRAYIDLYENGVHVIQRDGESIWTWDQLTHFGGKRETHGAYFIPMIFMGHNNFFAGETRAFRIGALTRGANILAHYCLMRMAQAQTPKMVKAIQRGELVQINTITVAKRSYKGTLSQYDYAYTDIEEHRFKNSDAIDSYKFQIKLRDENKFQDLGRVNALQAYKLMGIVDSLQNTNFVENALLDTMITTRRWKKFAQVNPFVVAVRVTMIIIVIGAIIDNTLL